MSFSVGGVLGHEASVVMQRSAEKLTRNVTGWVQGTMAFTILEEQPIYAHKAAEKMEVWGLIVLVYPLVRVKILCTHVCKKC